MHEPSEVQGTIRTRRVAIEVRRAALLRRLERGGIVRVLEVHNGLTAVIAETARADRNTRRRNFDGVWMSSFTNASSKARLDNEVVDLTARTHILGDVLDAGTLPVIYDADGGGAPEHLRSTVRTLERMGVSAVVVEDKVGLKRNSLHHDCSQQQEDPETFCKKIRAAIAARLTQDFLVVARIESLIVGAGVDDGLDRACRYVDAGANGVMIHSKAPTADEILEFCRRFRVKDAATPLLVAPTTYPQIMEEQLAEAGVDVVIYANHLLRSAYRAMVGAAETILANGRALEAEAQCFAVGELLSLLEARED